MTHFQRLVEQHSKVKGWKQFVSERIFALLPKAVECELHYSCPDNCKFRR